MVRFCEGEKLDFKGVPFIEVKQTTKYGYQAILGAYGKEGEFPALIKTDYKIGRARVEIAVPSGYTLQFLKDLRKNLSQAIQNVQHWERAKSLV